MADRSRSATLYILNEVYLLQLLQLTHDLIRNFLNRGISVHGYHLGAVNALEVIHRCHGPGRIVIPQIHAWPAVEATIDRMVVDL